MIEAAKRAGIRAVGIDIDPERIEESRQNAREAGVEQLVEFRCQDIFEADFSPATVVTMYLLPDVNSRLRPAILRTLKPGTRVVSHSFDLDEWEPEKLFMWLPACIPIRFISGLFPLMFLVSGNGR